MSEDVKQYLDPMEQRLLDKYACWMEGRRYPLDPVFDPIRPEDREDAGVKYVELLAKAQERAAKAQASAIAADKHEHDKSIEAQRLELEYAKLEVEKARIVADVMTAAIAAGQIDAVGGALQDVMGRLLPGPLGESRRLLSGGASAEDDESNG